jgi:uncharacterized protein
MPAGGGSRLRGLLLGGLLGLAVHLALSLLLVAIYLLPFGMNERIYHLVAFGWVVPGIPGAVAVGGFLGREPRGLGGRAFGRAVALAFLNAFVVAPVVMLLAVGAHPHRGVLVSNYFVVGIITAYLLCLPPGWGTGLTVLLHAAAGPRRWAAEAAAVGACLALCVPFVVKPVHREGLFARPRVNEAILRGRPADALAAIQAGEPIDVLDRTGSYPILEASQQGQAEVVRALVARGASLTVGDQHGWTAIHHAAERGQVEVLRVLVEAGADVNSRTAEAVTPLSLAVNRGYPEAVRFLLKSGARTDVAGATGAELVQAAWKNGREDVLMALTEAGIPGVSEAQRGGRLVLAALDRGDVDAALALVRQGADPDARHGGRDRALIQAIGMRQRPLAEALLAAGADANPVGYDEPPLVVAVRADPTMVGLLLARGARADARSGPNGPTALFEAASVGDVGSVKALLAAGADPRVSVQRRTALWEAAERGHDDVVALLRQAGASPEDVRLHDVRHRDIGLMEAAGKGDVPAVRLWLLRGADANHAHLAPLQKAAEAGHVEVVRLLLDAGADPLRQTTIGRTALEAAPPGSEAARLLADAVKARAGHTGPPPR